MAQSTEGKQSGDSTDIATNVKVWRYGVYFAMALVAFAYIIYFGIFLGQSATKDAQYWGSFGDFFGGLLNPLVAFAALYWLTESVKLQKTELAETRAELKKQADNGESSVKIAAITALVNVKSARVSALRGQLETLNQEYRKAKMNYKIGDASLTRVTADSLFIEIAQLDKELNEHVKILSFYL